MRSNRGVLLLASLLWLLPVQAQIREAAYIPYSHLEAADYEAVTYIPPVFLEPGKQALHPTATFDIRFSSDFPEHARAAFQYAADIWGFYLSSPVPIVVNADWESLGERTLGSAGPRLTGNFPGARYSAVWYPVALANSLAGRDIFTSSADIEARFNSAFGSWYFGLDGRVPPDKYDFVTVVLHELGHGLGFSGSFTVDDGDAATGDECPAVPGGYGCWGIPATTGSEPFPMVFDLFVEDANGVSLLAESVYPNPSQDLARVLQSDQVFFDGEFSRPLNDEVPISLYAPETFDEGSSYSHLDEGIFATPKGGPANPDALMTPFLARGEAIHDPGILTCAILEDFGWRLGEGCEARLATDIESELPSVSSYDLSPFFPNPTAENAEAVLRLSVPQQVRVEVFNVAGQRVSSTAMRIAAPETLRLDAGSLAPGVYLIRIQGETFIISRKLVRL